MNFLELCRSTRQWSGTTSNTIGSVIDQVGQIDLIVDAVAHAHDLIQSRHANWKFLRGEFSQAVSAVVPPAEARYTAATLGIATRFGDWLHDRVTGPNPYRGQTAYLTATGISDQSQLTEISWETWKIKYGRGVQTTGKPTEWAVSPDGKFCPGRFPDASYTIKGEYWKSGLVLDPVVDASLNPTPNTLTPEFPAHYHMAIVWRAVLLLTEKDEAQADVYARAEAKYSELLNQLERDQLDAITIGGVPLA